ncbi:hypothetical protein [Plantactinospora sp. DSM 117369]
MPLLDAALLDGLAPEARTKRRVDWPTLVRIGGIASPTENTRPDAGHGGPAVPLFAQLGTDAFGRPWEDYGDNAIDVFDSFRRRACAAARTA